MTKYFIVPGFGNSGLDHWQTHFERVLPNCRRIEQASWDKPACFDWVNKIDEAILKSNDLSNVVLITHSLGGIALAQWATKFKRAIKGAMIVGLPDIENPFEELNLQSFTPIPLTPLPFKSILVASSNDHWATLERSTFFANQWGSELVVIKDAGHINTSSGFGSWQEGLELLMKF